MIASPVFACASPIPTPPASPSPNEVRAFTPVPLPYCVICRYEVEGTTISLGCGHVLDTSCLRTIFENATRDESLFPPKCCQSPINLDAVRDHLSTPLITLYQLKAREFGTSDRVYCYNLACSAFLDAATAVSTSILCSDCRAETCGRCKEEAHAGRACSIKENEAMLELAKTRGWQRCPSCRYVVERTQGCPHMTCRCNQQFCYLCAATWKTCACAS